MSTDITGWIEVKKNDHWFGVVKIPVLMQRNYLMFDFLFGGRSGNYAQAQAAMRGIPEDRSEEIRQMLGDSNGMEGTWIGWDELEAVDWSQHETLLSDDWRRLFALMRLFAQDRPPNGVRLIVDFF